MKRVLDTTSWKAGWQHFWAQHKERLFLGSAFLLVGVFSFEAGLLQKSLGQTSPLIIRVADSPENTLPKTDQTLPLANTSKTTTSAIDTTNSVLPTDCQFVGSKKSNKYHHPASRCAKQIKAENKRCFASAEEATAKGYLPGCLEP